MADAPPIWVRLGVAPDDALTKRCLMAVAAALATAGLLSTTLMLLGLRESSNASLVQRANRYMHVFQNSSYVAGNVPSGTLRPAGRTERYVVYAYFAVYAALGTVAALFGWTVRSREAALPGFASLLAMGMALAAAALLLLTMLPAYWSGCARAGQNTLMRTLFNNAVYNSLLDLRPFTTAMLTEGPGAALRALRAVTEADQPAAVPFTLSSAVAGVQTALEQGVDTAVATASSETSVQKALAQGGQAADAAITEARSEFAGVLSRASATAWKQVGPGFSKLYHAVADWTLGVSRESVVDPLQSSVRLDAWVSALITLNVYDHLIRNVPRNSPFFQEAAAIFTRNDYERWGVDFFSYFVFGQYSVIANRALAHRDEIPDDIRAQVLSRVNARMSIINGLCDRASVGILNAADVYFDLRFWILLQVGVHLAAFSLGAVAPTTIVGAMMWIVSRLSGVPLDQLMPPAKAKPGTAGTAGTAGKAVVVPAATTSTATKEAGLGPNPPASPAATAAPRRFGSTPGDPTMSQALSPAGARPVMQAQFTPSPAPAPAPAQAAVLSPAPAGPPAAAAAAAAAADVHSMVQNVANKLPGFAGTLARLPGVAGMVARNLPPAAVEHLSRMPDAARG